MDVGTIWIAGSFDRRAIDDWFRVRGPLDALHPEPGRIRSHAGGALSLMQPTFCAASRSANLALVADHVCNEGLCGRNRTVRNASPRISKEASLFDKRFGVQKRTAGRL